MDVLCIDDCEDILDNLCELLLMEGYQPIAAKNGQLGVEIAVVEIPDFIICNIQMPIMNGYEVIEVIRALSKTRHIPFLFLSADVSLLTIKTAIHLGADYYLEKPFSCARILDIIKEHDPKT